MTRAPIVGTGTNAIGDTAALLMLKKTAPIHIAHTIPTAVAIASTIGTIITNITMIAVITAKAQGTSATAIITAAGSSRLRVKSVC